MQYESSDEVARLEEILRRVSDETGASSDAEVARALKAGSSSVATWRARGTIPYSNICEFANEKGLSANWLLYGKGFRSLAEARTGVSESVVLGRQLAGPDNDPAYAEIPFYDVTVAAGHGRMLTDDDLKPAEKNHYRKTYLKKRGLSASALIELVVSGDSMEDELRDGDTVLVDTSDKRVRGGSIFVFRQGDDLLVKYLQALPGDRIQVTSENGDAFPPYVIERTDLESGDVQIIGRVVRQGRDR